MKILPINNIYNNYTQNKVKLSKPSVKQSSSNRMSNAIYYIPTFKGKIPATDKEYKLMFKYLKSSGRDFSTETISKEMPYFDELCKKFKFDINKKFDNEKDTLYELAKRGAFEIEGTTYYGINKYEQFIFNQFPLEKICSIMLSIHHYLPLRTLIKGFDSSTEQDRLNSFKQFKELYKSEKNRASKRTLHESFMTDVLLSYNQLTPAEQVQFAAQFPVSIRERDFMNWEEFKEYGRPELIAPLKNQRLKNIIERNGVGTPQKLLACLNDELMAPELLDIPYAYDNHSNIIKDIAQTEDAVAMQKFLDKLSEMPFIPNSDEICEAANIAGRNGNVKLLQLLKSKKVNLEPCRQNVREFTPEVQEFFRNLKIQHPGLVEDLMKAEPSEISQIYDLSKYDINSRDKDGNTILLKAAKNLDLDRIKALKNIDSVDWNATNQQGENISMILLNHMSASYRWRNDSKIIKDILAELRALPDEKFDINYVNQTPIYTARERIVLKLPYTTLHKFCLDSAAEYNECILDELLKFKNINPNICPDESRPLLQLTSLSPSTFSMFNKLYNHPNTNKNITYLGQHWLENLLNGDMILEKSTVNEAANIAGRNGNVKLLQLLKSKKVNLESCRQHIEEFTPDVQEFFHNLKIQHPGLVEDLMNAEPSEMSQIYDLSKYDINSRDKDGNTILLKAAKNLDLDRIKALKNIDSVDWNVTNQQGENISMILLNHMSASYRWRNDSKIIKDILAELRALPDGKFDINYVNQAPLYPVGERIVFMPHTTLHKFCLDSAAEYNECILDELLKFKNINPNICPDESRPLLQLTSLSPSTFSMFNKLYNHPNTNKNITYLGQHWLKNLLNGDMILKKSTLNLLNDIINDRLVDKMKNIYEENGSFSIDEIEKFIKYDNFKQIMTQPLNSIGENIAHFLPEIFVEEGSEDYNKLRNIFEKLQNAKFNFNQKDNLFRTPLMKAIEAENVEVAKLLLEFGKPIVFDFYGIKKLALESDNQELKNLFENFKG